MFTGRTKPIRITGDPDNQCPHNWSYTVCYSLVQISSVLEDESTPEPHCDRKDYIQWKKSSDTNRNGARNPPACSAVLPTTCSTLNFQRYFENSHRRHIVTAKQSYVLPVYSILHALCQFPLNLHITLAPAVHYVKCTGKWIFCTTLSAMHKMLFKNTLRLPPLNQKPNASNGCRVIGVHATHTHTHTHTHNSFSKSWMFLTNQQNFLGHMLMYSPSPQNPWLYEWPPSCFGWE